MTKIMLVEDDNNLREIYEARLSAEGFDIVSAQDGEAALALAAQEKPDLVISDVMMPKISGFEMLDILRNTQNLRDVKVIMLTALGQSEDSARAASLGADRYLVKSQVTLEDIVKAAHDLLEGTPADDVLTVSAEPAAMVPTAAPVVEAALPFSPAPELAAADLPAEAEPTARPVISIAVTTPPDEMPAAAPVLEPAAAAPSPAEPATVTAIPVATEPTDWAAPIGAGTSGQFVPAADEPVQQSAADEPAGLPGLTVVQPPVEEPADTTGTQSPSDSTTPPQPDLPLVDSVVQPTETTIDEAQPQGIAEEEATMQAKIDAFIQSQEDVPTPVEQPADTIVELPVAHDSPEPLPQPPVPAAQPEVAAEPPVAQSAPEAPHIMQPVDTPAGATTPSDTDFAVPPVVEPVPVAVQPAPEIAQPNTGAPVFAPAPPPAAPVAVPDPVAGPAETPAPQFELSPISGKKVIIAPLSSGPKTDIHQLLAVEEAKAAAQQAANATGAVVPPPVTTMPLPPNNPSASNPNKFDPNSIAL